MTIPERIQKELTEAMKAKDSLRMDVLRGMKTAIKHKEVEKRHPLQEAEALQVINSLVRQRKDSIEQFTQGGRQDLVEREESELKILESYLPAAIDDREIHDVIVEIIAELEASSPKDLGRVMKAVMTRLAGGRVDGKLINEMVRAQLEGAGKKG